MLAGLLLVELCVTYQIVLVFDTPAACRIDNCSDEDGWYADVSSALPLPVACCRVEYGQVADAMGGGVSAGAGGAARVGWLGSSDGCWNVSRR